MSTGYWWIGRPNFGDLLTPLLMAHFCQLEIPWSIRTDADLIMVGSLLNFMPETWGGIVAGAGMLHDQKKRLPMAHVLGLRGPLSAKAMGIKPSSVVLGDPGLLANELAPGVRKEHLLGLVPHWSDTELETRTEWSRYDPLVIRPSGDPVEVIRQIGSCRKIIASSLHGIIVADAFGIPRRTEMAHIFEREGGDFKFRDHAATVDVPFEVGLTQQAKRFVIQDRQHALYDMIQSLPALLKDP